MSKNKKWVKYIFAAVSITMTCTSYAGLSGAPKDPEAVVLYSDTKKDSTVYIFDKAQQPGQCNIGLISLRMKVNPRFTEDFIGQNDISNKNRPQDPRLECGAWRKKFLKGMGQVPVAKDSLILISNQNGAIMCKADRDLVVQTIKSKALKVLTGKSFGDGIECIDVKPGPNPYNHG